MDRKKKIYMITFHRAQSYGAFLQAYALQNCSELANENPIYIDYYPDRFHYRNYVKITQSGNILKHLIKMVPAIICKTRMHMCIQKYVNKYLKTTEKVTRVEDLEQLNDSADIFLTGSDQIWDLRYGNIEQIMPYYLNFVHKARYAYSSSCGEMQYYKNKEKDDYKLVLDELKKFTAISVRESESANDLNACGSYCATMMLDPTFLLNKSEWKKVATEYKGEGYILVYGLYRNKQLFSYARRLADKYNMKIVNICDMLDYLLGAKNIINVTPFKLISLIMNAAHVVTDSFHGCALSINFEKQLHIFNPLTSKVRINNIISLFGIQNRLVDQDLILEQMNYKCINAVLKREREKAHEYLVHIN